MALTAWTRDLGAQQGRIAPTGWVQPEGTQAMVLGYDLPGHTEVLNIGDFVQVAQAATIAAGARVLRVSVRLRPPTSLPAGVAWRFKLLIDGVVRATHRVAPTRTRDLVDLAANVAKLAGGAHTVALRLELEAA